MSIQMTHAELVQKGKRWLLGFKNGCAFVFTETHCQWRPFECPDVIGWNTRGLSTLIEVKVSRSDFLRDKKKIVRRYEDVGMGHRRFYLCPDKMISPDEVPEKWGLLYANGRGISIVKEPQKFNIEQCSYQELPLLVAKLRLFLPDQYVRDPIVTEEKRQMIKELASQIQLVGGVNGGKS